MMQRSTSFTSSVGLTLSPETVPSSNRHSHNTVHDRVRRWHERSYWRSRVSSFLDPRSTNVLRLLIVIMTFCTTAACSPKIVAEGVHHALPAEGALIGVWGTHPTLEHAAIQWLSQRGIHVLDPSEIRAQLSGERNVAVMLNEEAVLGVAEQHDMGQMVLIRLVGDQRAPAVLVRAFTLPERQVAWAGSARYDEYLSKPTVNHLVIAVCRALEAAWKVSPLSDSERCVIHQGR